MQPTVVAGFPLLFILSPKELVLDTHLKGTVDGRKLCAWTFLGTVLMNNLCHYLKPSECCIKVISVYSFNFCVSRIETELGYSEWREEILNPRQNLSFFVAVVKCWDKMDVFQVISLCRILKRISEFWSEISFN